MLGGRPVQLKRRLNALGGTRSLLSKTKQQRTPHPARGVLLFYSTAQGSASVGLTITPRVGKRTPPMGMSGVSESGAIDRLRAR